MELTDFVNWPLHLFGNLPNHKRMMLLLTSTVLLMFLWK